jgi:uncharacterized protein
MTIGFCLSDNLSKMLKRNDISESTKQNIRECLMNTITELRHIIKHQQAEEMSIAYSVHRDMQEIINKFLRENEVSKDVTCKQGCSFCCYLNVDISHSEAKLLLYYAEELGIEVDWELIQKQSNAKSINQLKFSDRKCPFLKDGACSVYEHRPASCRKYHVVTDPKLCDTQKHNGARVTITNIWQAEILASALFNVYESGTMSKMLLKAKS